MNMPKKKENNDTAFDLEKEQADLIKLMESSISPEILAAVLRAYDANDDSDEQLSLNISYEGTIHA